MKSALIVLAVCLSTTALGRLALAEDACCPPTNAPSVAQADPSLPQGHPPVESKGEMPAGHPQVESNGEMPAGHPPTPNGDHSQMGALGTLVVKVTNGTPQAQAPANAPVIVEFYRKGKKYHQLNTQLDEHGVVMVENIAIQDVIQPVVTVTHAGVAYRQVAHPMAAARPDQVLKMTVFESTDQEPQWQASMRHVFTRVGPHGLEVTEVLVVNNPDKKAWIGNVTEEGHKPVTLNIPITQQAQFVQFGPNTDATKMEITKGKIINHAPLLPGANEIAVGYVIAPTDGKAVVRLYMACDVKHMMLLTPDDGSEITVAGLEGPQTMPGNGEPMKVFSATNLTKDAKLQVTISGLKDIQPAAKPEDAGAMAQPAQNTGQSSTPKLVAGIGGATLMVAAVAIMIFRSSNKTAATANQA